jgi:hypothetical protein
MVANANGTMRQDLQALLPGLDVRIQRLGPRLLAKLLADEPGVGSRLVESQTLFPGADVLTLGGQR